MRLRQEVEKREIGKKRKDRKNTGREGNWRKTRGDEW